MKPFEKVEDNRVRFQFDTTDECFILRETSAQRLVRTVSHDEPLSWFDFSTLVKFIRDTTDQSKSFTCGVELIPVFASALENYKSVINDKWAKLASTLAEQFRLEASITEVRLQIPDIIPDGMD